MIINIASFGGRSHLLDLARELEKFGHTVRFYSYVPTRRAMKFGLKKECSYSILWFTWPFLVLFKLFGYGKWREDLYNYCCDLFLAFYMKPCDLFIGQSPMHKFSICRAKKKFQAMTILERGISHVLYQEKVLKSIPATRNAMSSLHVKRDLMGYQYPDYISVGSEHVRQTFLQYGYPDGKIFVNNYGANLSFFHPTMLPMEGEQVFDVLMVGQWCYRKGCDLVVEAVKELNVNLLHVGTITDMDFPKDTHFTHIDSRPENELIAYYQRSRIFVMPSRDEGLALVQAQALACGLPLVCSAYSGGIDLRKALSSPNYVIEMKNYSAAALVAGIREALLISHSQDGKLRDIMSEKDSLSFTAYGKRYNDFIVSLAAKKNGFNKLTNQ